MLTIPEREKVPGTFDEQGFQVDDTNKLDELAWGRFKELSRSSEPGPGRAPIFLHISGRAFDQLNVMTLSASCCHQLAKTPRKNSIGGY
ncbi:MAG: hypothetical protein ACC628_18180 [Pirellulaceae bacterium]